MTKQELLKAAKPILFNGEMVRAILDGRKTMTRRICKDADEYTEPHGEFIDNEKRTYAVQCFGDKEHTDYVALCEVKMPICVGDILYVRETWTKISDWSDTDPQVGLFDGYIYKSEWCGDEHPKWRPSIHMPKEAARIFLRVTGARVESAGYYRAGRKKRRHQSPRKRVH